MKNLEEQGKKAFCYQKLFTVWINCSSDLKISKVFLDHENNCLDATE